MTPTISKQTKIGVVGVGRMGANMARCLDDAGFPVVAVYDVNEDAAAALANQLDCEVPETLAALTASCDVILTMVSNDEAMTAIFEDHPHNLLMRAEGKWFINGATVSPSIHRWVRQRCDAIGAHVLECPIASSIPQARDGTLLMMCAGERTVFDALQPILQTLTTEAIYVGNTGKAAEVKALVNMVMNMNTAALAEGLGLADALGLDLDVIQSVFAKTGANSRVLETDGTDMVARDHEVYFSAAHAAKDSGIALALAKEQGLTLPLATATKAQYDQLIACGLGELDKSAVSELTFVARQPKTSSGSTV